MFIPFCALLLGGIGFCLGGFPIGIFGLICGALLGAYLGG